MKMRKLQQGDVLLHQVAGLPDGAESVKPIQGRLILAEGEATGHAHAVMVADDVELFEKAGTLYLRNAGGGPVDLVHEEHHTQTVAPGTYEIGIVIEVDPFEDEVREVAD